MKNSSDDARAAISEQLAEWKHPLDCRRKNTNRVRENEWFTGERWSTFCASERGSPGAPLAIGTIVMIIAKDLQAQGVDSGTDEMAPAGAAAGDAPSPSAPAAGCGREGKGGRGGRGSRGGRGRNAFTLRATAGAAAGQVDNEAEADAPQVQHFPTAAELSADVDELRAIRDMFGSRAQTLINVLLSCEAYSLWHFPFVASTPLFCEHTLREARAFHNMRAATDMVEIFERVSIRSHKSFLPHGAVYKVLSRDILEV
eukprot:798691-Pleurochrysis_carterae.AAC.1